MVPIKHITPFVEIRGRNTRGLHITQCDLDINKAGWLRLYVLWSAAKKEYLFKYPILGYTSFGYRDTYISLKFPDVKDAHIDVGIQCISRPYSEDYNSNLLNHTYKYFENLKYGIAAYFAPKSFDLIGYRSLTRWEKGSTVEPNSSCFA